MVNIMVEIGYGLWYQGCVNPTKVRYLYPCAAAAMPAVMTMYITLYVRYTW